MDGDGDLDVLVGLSGSHDVWLNDGSGRFVDNGQDLAYWNQSISLGDLDGDGDLDAWVRTRDFSKVWLNDGSGQFADSGQELGDSYCRDVSLGDLDGDGDLDAWAAGYDSSRVWLNDGSGQFVDSGQFLEIPSASSVSLGDLDGDGDLDALVGTDDSGAGDHSNRVWLNDGTGLFTDSGQALGHSDTQCIALGDLDGGRRSGCHGWKLEPSGERGMAERRQRHVRPKRPEHGQFG